MLPLCISAILYCPVGRTNCVCSKCSCFINPIYVTVMSILTCFLHLLHWIHRLAHTGGRGNIYNAEQEAAIVDMVVANNAIRLCEIQAAVIADQGAFRNINSVSLATIDRVLALTTSQWSSCADCRFTLIVNYNIIKEARLQYMQICYCNALSYHTITCNWNNLLYEFVFFLENDEAWSWRGTSHIHSCGWSWLQPL